MAKRAKPKATARPRKAGKPRRTVSAKQGGSRTGTRVARARAQARPAGLASKQQQRTRGSKRARPAATRTAARSSAGKKSQPGTSAKSPRLDRIRRRLEDIIPTPPSSLNLDRHGSAVRTGRAELAEARADHASMTPAITGGDVDADLETAYFSGDEAPGGDNPTPDQDVVEDIGRALGIEYQDNEELRSGDKVADRDKHRWELDPASSEDYRERKK